MKAKREEKGHLKVRILLAIFLAPGYRGTFAVLYFDIKAAAICRKAANGRRREENYRTEQSFDGVCVSYQ